MREFRLEPDADTLREEAVRAKHQRDTQRWRHELRPRAMRLFAARTQKLPWSRALLKLVVEELFPDDLFSELIGNLERVPQRKWPHMLAIAVALRHSWRRDGLARVARRLRVSLATASTPKSSRRRSTQRKSRPSRRRFSGSPRPRQGSPLRSDPAKRGSRP